MKFPSMRSLTKWALLWLQKKQAEANLHVALSHIKSLEGLVLSAASDLENAGRADEAEHYREVLAMRGKGDWARPLQTAAPPTDGPKGQGGQEGGGRE